MFAIIVKVIDRYKCRKDVQPHLDEKGILPEEQRGCRKKLRRTSDELFIDRAIMKEVKFRNKNLAMGWIDNKKAYDRIPPSWNMECLKMFGIAEDTKRLFCNSMEN